MGYFPVKYDSRVVIYEHKMFIRLATGNGLANKNNLVVTHMILLVLPIDTKNNCT